MSAQRRLTSSDIRRLLEDSDSGSDSDGLEELTGDVSLSSDSEDELRAPSAPARATLATEGAESGGGEPPTRRARTTRSNAVFNLETALDPVNYDDVQLQEGEVFKVVTSKKTRTSEEQSVTWTSDKPSVTGRQSAADVMSTRPGPRGRARHVQDPEQAWRLFFSDEMISLMVEHTNKKIQETRKTLAEETLKKKGPTYRDTTQDEMNAFLGLMYTRGLLGQNLHSAQRVFHEKTGHPVFSATMAQSRFATLHSHLSFDDAETRATRWKDDRFAACREIFELFNNNCLKMMIADEYLALDETLYPTRNKIGFRQYNPNKPAKYGLLFRSVNATSYPYTYTAHVYSGKPENQTGPFYIQGVTETVQYLVSKMLEKNEVTGRNISMDRLYTSIPLAEWLLERKITMVGTLQSNRKGIPEEIKNTSGREAPSYRCVWELTKQKISLHSYVVHTKSTGKRNVLLLCTVPPIVGVTKDDKRKPAVYKLYDMTKGGTDIVDQRMGSFTSKSKSRKWTVNVLSYVMDTCRVNAQTVLALNQGTHPAKMSTFDFGWELAWALIMPYLHTRARVGLPKRLQLNIDLLTGKGDEEEQAGAGPSSQNFPCKGARRRCAECIAAIPVGEGHKAAKDTMKKVTMQCSLCGSAVCESHVVVRCGRH